MNIILSGPPRAGKTTICRMIMDRADRAIRGFVTEDIRHEGDRVGFMVEFENGASRVLSHVDFDDGPMVGKYTVDLETMDWVLRTMESWQDDSPQLYIIDEVGKMELKHDEFSGLVDDFLDSDTDLLATVPKVGPDYVGEIRSRQDVEVLDMTEENREDVLAEIVELLDVKPVGS